MNFNTSPKNANSNSSTTVSQYESIQEEVCEVIEKDLESLKDYEFSAYYLSRCMNSSMSLRAVPIKMEGAKLSFPYYYEFVEERFVQKPCVNSLKEPVSITDIRKKIKKHKTSVKVRPPSKRVSKKSKKTEQQIVSVLDKIY